jgi:diguanylate cyclase (GGDEF)-like protein
VRFGELDDFKQVNDTRGHQAGDAALVELARRLTGITREVDLVARYGGEEFALVLPRTDAAGGRLLGEKVCHAVAAEPFPADGEPLCLTVSGGVATYPDHGRTIKALVEAADAALYRAKAGGKNRVEGAAEPDASEGSSST